MAAATSVGTSISNASLPNTTASVTETAAPSRQPPSDARPPLWKVWVYATRPHTLTASLSPCLVGYAIAASDSSNSTADTGKIASIARQWFLFCICIQMGTNLHNDYADNEKGADTEKRKGQARATQKGWILPETIKRASTMILTVALSIGVSLMPAHLDYYFWFVVFTSIFNAFAYTGGEYPLGYIGMRNVSIAYAGLGDVFCFLYFGLIAVTTIPYLAMGQQEADSGLIQILSSPQTKTWLWQALPASLLSTAIIVVNNIRDREEDDTASKLTLAVRFGRTFSQVEYTLLIGLAYTWLVMELRNDDWKQSSLWVILLFLLTLTFAISNIKALWTLDGRDLNPYVGKTALLELVFCTLQCLHLTNALS